MARFKTFSAPWSAAGLGASLIAAALLAGCGKTAAQPAAQGTVDASYNKASGKLERIAYDRNHDGKPDAWLKMQGTQVISAELDENFDGAIDRREFYANAAATPVAAAATASALPARTEIVRAEQSTLDDGKMNRVETYAHGVLAHVEEDTNGDGRVDKWETWSGGTLQVVALDTKGAGRPDRRLVYPADGSEPRMEFDTTGDGTFTPQAR